MSYFGRKVWKLFINLTFRWNVPICKLIQQLHSPCHIHHFHRHLPAGSRGTAMGVYCQPHTYSLSRLVRLSRLNTVHLSQSNPGSGLPVSPLTPLSSLGPLKEGGSSSDRTTLTAHQPQPDTFLKAEPGRSQCSLFPFFCRYLIPSFSDLNFSIIFYSVIVLSRFPFVHVIHRSWLMKKLQFIFMCCLTQIPLKWLMEVIQVRLKLYEENKPHH